MLSFHREATSTGCSDFCWKILLLCSFQMCHQNGESKSYCTPRNASVLPGCYICFTHMFQMFHMRCMLHSKVSCCKCFVFQRYVQRVMGSQPGRQGPEDGACGVPRVLRMGHARPLLGSRVLLARRERRGQEEGAVGARRGEADGGGVRMWRGTRWTGTDAHVLQ